VSLRTPLCELLGIELPIVQAPITYAPALVAAVSEAGGLGIIQLSWLEPDEARAVIRETRRLTSRPFGVNLVLEWPQDDQLRGGARGGRPGRVALLGRPGALRRRHP